ncbi:MAG: hypothetical protein AB1750_08040 [Chloroflexota bacterium]
MGTFSIYVILLQTPFFLIDLCGLIIAITRRKRHPRVSLLAGIYFSGHIILWIIDVGFGSTIFANYLFKLEYSITELASIVRITSIVMTVVGSLLAIILLFAIFGWRDEKKPIEVVEKKLNPEM